MGAARRGAAAAAAALAVAVLAAACGSGQAGGAGAGLSTAAGAAQVTRFPPGHRKTAPVLRGKRLGGGTLTVRPAAGHVTVVNVWGSWCVPCREEASALEDAHTATKAAGTGFVGVDERDTGPSALAFERAHHITYPSLSDSGGALLLGFRGVVPVQAVPTTIVIDSRGRVAARVIGKVGYLTLLSLIRYARGAAAPTSSPAASRRA